MKLSTLLIIVYIIIIITIIIVLNSLSCDRNYWKRMLPMQQCPFDNKLDYRVANTFGNENVPKEIGGIVSYSLFGNYTKYSVKLLESVKIIPKMLPGWYARVYVGIDIPDDIKNQLIKNGAQVYIMGPSVQKGFEAALWRFGPAGELYPFISLDADDLFDERIASNTKAWLKSGKIFASFSRHAFVVPLAAGLWGARPIKTEGGLKPVFPNIQEHINSYCEHWFGFDEAYLKTNVWPLFKQYGYYQCSGFYLTEVSIIGIIIIIAAMIYSIYVAKNLER